VPQQPQPQVTPQPPPPSTGFFESTASAIPFFQRTGTPAVPPTRAPPCAADEYETVRLAGRADRACAALTVCTNAQFIATRATATTDRVCSAITVCSAEQYQSTAPRTYIDCVCSAVTICAVGTEFQAAAPTSTSDRICSKTKFTSKLTENDGFSYGSYGLLARSYAEPTEDPTPTLTTTPTPSPTASPTGAPTAACSPGSFLTAGSPGGTGDVDDSYDSYSSYSSYESFDDDAVASWSVWTITSGSSACAVVDTDDGQSCIQDTAGDYEANQDCTFTFTGAGTVTRAQWGLEHPGASKDGEQLKLSARRIFAIFACFFFFLHFCVQLTPSFPFIALFAQMTTFVPAMMTIMAPRLVRMTMCK
jgi:hypothetical protein